MTFRMGMVGGGTGAFIGEVHRKAARMDGLIEVVGGVFGSRPRRSRSSGIALGFAPDRVYGGYEEMVAAESARPGGDRIDVAAIVTPNDTHFPIAEAFLKAGFDVMCEKPMTLTLKEARALRRTVRRTGRVFGLMHTYTGYPMVKLARDLVRQGDLGAVRKVVARYPQGWLAKPIERRGSKQAAWRTDPARSGAAGCMGDIGTHAANLAEYVTGLRIESLCADLTAFVRGRRLDDDGHVLLRFRGGAKGVLTASQIAAGVENGLGIEVYGEAGGLSWRQEEPNALRVLPLDAPEQIWRRGNPYVAARSPAAAAATRVPPGHPEGYIEAFANHYTAFAAEIRARRGGGGRPEALDFPGVEEGVRGMAFIETAVASSAKGSVWRNLPAT